MWAALGIALMILLCGFTSHGKSSSSTRTVSVAIELEDLPDVDKYELEVSKSSGKKTKPLSFSQNRSDFRIKLEVGNYQVRTRIVSKQGETGPWSEWSELLARPEEVADFEIPNYNFSVRKNQAWAEVNLKWSRAAGAEKYVLWIENQTTGLVVSEPAKNNEAVLKLKTGEYKIGIQSVSKDGIKSKIKYVEDSFFVGKTMLPKIQVRQPVAGAFKWTREAEAEVKIDLYRKAFFGDKYLRVSSVKQSADAWRLAADLQPGEYRLDFQYISEAFENGPVETILFVKKPTEKNFSATENKTN